MLVKSAEGSISPYFILLIGFVTLAPMIASDFPGIVVVVDTVTLAHEGSSVLVSVTKGISPK